MMDDVVWSELFEGWLVIGAGEVWAVMCSSLAIGLHADLSGPKRPAVTGSILNQ